MDHTEHTTRRRELFPIRESDATFNHEQRRNWGGYGGPSGGGGGGHYGGATATGGGAGTFYGHVSGGGGGGGGGSYGGATATGGGARTFYGHVSGGSGGSGGGGASSAAAAAGAAAAHAAAVAQAVSRNNSALGLLGFHSGGQSDPVLSQIGSLLAVKSAVSKVLGGKVDTGLKASASIPAAPKVQMPKPPKVAAVHAVAIPHPLASIGAAVGQHASPIVYAASLSPAKQHLLAQVDTQNAAHNALAQAGVNAGKQGLAANQALTAATNAQRQAASKQTFTNNPNLLIHPGAGQGLWGQLNMKRLNPNPGANPFNAAPLNQKTVNPAASRFSQAAASPISALTNLFGGGSKPNFKAIGAAAGQAAKPAPIAKVAAAQANTRTSALKSLNTAAGKQAATNTDARILAGAKIGQIPSGLSSLPTSTGGHLGPNNARFPAHPQRQGLFTPGQIKTLANRPVGPGDIASAQRNAALAISTAHGLKASPNVLKALLVNIQGAPGFVIGNRAQIASRARDFVNTARQFDKPGVSPVELKNATWQAAPQAVAAHVGPKALANSKAFNIHNLFALTQHVTGVKLGNTSSVGQGPANLPQNLKDLFVSAGKKYGIDPAVLFGIASNETGDKTKGTVFKNQSTSSAGAVGWMQFLPSTWAKYGVKAPGGSGTPDPHNVADAVYSAANYLKASGYKQGNPQAVRQAILAYNHAGWYVNDVLNTSRLWQGGAGMAGQGFPSSGAPGTAGSSGAGALSTSGSVGSSAGSSGAGSAASAATSKAAKQAQQDVLNRRGASLALATQLLSGKSGALSRVNGKKGSKTPTLESLLALR